MTTKTPITVARGDGIGPEIMAATLKILEAAGAELAIEEIEVGQKVYERGISSGIESSSWESLLRTKVVLKAPITTPQGGGFKSLNVTMRKTLGLYANVRPCVAYSPYVTTNFPKMNLVIVRENEEDLYTGIEHQQTPNVTQCLKLISQPGTEKIVRYAFEYAKHNNRKKVTCFSKDNIMKITDGLFHRTFDQVAKEYPDIDNEHWIIDIGAAKVAANPEQFDVIVMPNLYGDIVSDIAAEVSGSVGLGCSANIGMQCAMFEAIHGSAPDIAGQGIANPSGLLLAAVMMLVHIGQPSVATNINNAWLKTIEDGIHTGDIYDEATSAEKVGTEAFADAVIARLGQQPEKLAPVNFDNATEMAEISCPISEKPKAERTLVGTDVFVYCHDKSVQAIAELAQGAAGDDFELTIIANRGLKVWPGQMPETCNVDHWRCRYKSKNTTATNAQLAGLLARMDEQGLEFIQIENLYDYDGKPGYSMAQGE
ncbi:MAG: isocitrate dehydrogenase [Legionellales bacterium]|nr:isocitrate dehydrogenase [Legionellales bacterium]